MGKIVAWPLLNLKVEWKARPIWLLLQLKCTCWDKQNSTASFSPWIRDRTSFLHAWGREGESVPITFHRFRLHWLSTTTKSTWTYSKKISPERDFCSVLTYIKKAFLITMLSPSEATIIKHWKTLQRTLMVKFQFPKGWFSHSAPHLYGNQHVVVWQLHYV